MYVLRTVTIKPSGVVAVSPTLKCAELDAGCVEVVSTVLTPLVAASWALLVAATCAPLSVVFVGVAVLLLLPAA